MTEREINALCNKVRQTAYDIHVYLGPGHLEKVYENALVHRLRKAGVEIKQQYPLNVYDQDGTLLGEYFADLLVEGALIIEASCQVARSRTCRSSSRLSKIWRD